jgi:hypothetical protein
MKSTIEWDIKSCIEPTFRRNISVPSSGSNRPSKAGGKPAYSTLKMKPIGFPETSDELQRTTRRSIPEDNTPQTELTF